MGPFVPSTAVGRAAVLEMVRGELGHRAHRSWGKWDRPQVLTVTRGGKNTMVILTRRHPSIATVTIRPMFVIWRMKRALPSPPPPYGEGCLWSLTVRLSPLR